MRISHFFPFLFSFCFICHRVQRECFFLFLDLDEKFICCKAYRYKQLLSLLFLLTFSLLLSLSYLEFFDMEGDVVLLGLMEWNAASTATQLIPLPTTTEMCYELLTDGVCIMYISVVRHRIRTRKTVIC